MTAYRDRQLNEALREKVQQLEEELATWNSALEAWGIEPERVRETIQRLEEERDRARGVKCLGVSHDLEQTRHFIQLNDDAGETKTSFCIEPGETVGDALDRLDAGWQASLKRQGIAHAG